MGETAGFRLVHDVLDGQLVDRREERVGRIDDLVLELREGEAPRVAAILVGGPARADRVGRWATWLDRVVRTRPSLLWRRQRRVDDWCENST